jgi:hypothetical protein
MSVLPAWADDLVCETLCESCRRPLFLTLPDILQAQRTGCACGRRQMPLTPPGLPEILALVTSLEATAGHLRATRPERGRLERVS